jgi:hypothetical protein
MNTGSGLRDARSGGGAMSLKDQMVTTAKNAYEGLKNSLKTYDNYWQIGCCFDSMTDYLLEFGVGPDLEMTELILTRYTKSDGAWYDDYAWWAIAAAKVWDPDYRIFFEGHLVDCAWIATTCWDIVENGKGDKTHFGSPNAYDMRDKEDPSNWVTPPTRHPAYNVDPRFHGEKGSGRRGTWQYDIFSIQRAGTNWKGPKEPVPCTNPSFPGATRDDLKGCGSLIPDPPNPSKLPFWAGFYQLTVMNALYFLLALRLEQARSKPPGPPDAEPPDASQGLGDEYGFLRAWFGWDKQYDPVTVDESLLRNPGNDKAILVGERVSTYAKAANGTFPPVQYWNKNRSWAGDQGMILNALTGYLLFRGDDADNNIRNLIPMLIDGYITYQLRQGQPQSCYPDPGEEVFSVDPSDYLSGIGVFMRGLYQAFRPADSPVREKARGNDFQVFLARCGNWALGFKSFGEPFDYLNVLATATAVHAMIIENPG